MRRTLQFTYSLALVALLSVITNSGQAATINYGDFEDYAGGGVIEYTDVREASTTDAIPLFNAPDVVVNTIDFDPAFGSSSGGGSVDITDGQLNFEFNMLPGTGLTSLAIDEGGDFSFFGAGTAATSVGYGLFAEVTVLEVDGVAVTPFTISGSMSSSTDAASSPGLNQPWSLGLFLDLGLGLTTNGHGGYTHGVTAGEFVLNNTLVSTSETGTIAFIAKKDFNITPGGDLDQNDVPEPSTAILALVGLAFASVPVLRRKK